MGEDAYDLPPGSRWEQIADQGPPLATEDGHRAVMSFRVVRDDGQVTNEVWECVVCGTSHYPTIRDRTGGPPRRFRTDCQTALTKLVLDS